MKSMLIVLAAASGVAATGWAHGSAELAQKYGCTNCHGVDSRKVGPSLKEIAAKYKDQSSAEAKLVGALAQGTGHPKVNAPESDLAALVKWTLAR